MLTQNTRETRFCPRCDASTGVDDVVTNHSLSDPLQVTECANCGAVVDIGSHRW